jgi:hypothetical protein
LTGADFVSGLLDAADALDRPVIVRDREEDLRSPVPPAWPAVVVAVSEDRPPQGPVPGADLALTSGSDPPSPWVAVADLEASVALIEDRVRLAPQAALTLVQVLRVTESLSRDAGLVLESLAYSALQAGPEFARWRAGRPPRPSRPVTGDEVLAERINDLLLVTLNRPEVHNAYNARMRDLLCDALAAAAADPTCRVELRGAGPSFGSGGDLDEFGTAPDPATAHFVRTARSPARLLLAMADRVEAHLHGVCAGSGIELPAFARRVRAVASTRIWLPEVAMGLIPGAGGTASLTKRIGRHRTAWMGVTGSEVDVATALRWGLIDEISGQGE